MYILKECCWFHKFYINIVQWILEDGTYAEVGINLNLWMVEHSPKTWISRDNLFNKYADGDVFEGNYENDFKHGYGKMTWSSGQTFVGEWRYGKMVD